MATTDASGTNGTGAGNGPVQLGRAIRAAREQRGLSLRELARRVSVSPSFVSQIELGKANPSVGTLYSLVSVLGTTLDDLIGEQAGEAGAVAVPAAAAGGARPAVEGAYPGDWPRIDVPVQKAGDRKRVQMSGVVWERLTHDHDPYVDFLHVEYAPGSPRARRTR
jgi:transcriptional regulator with XRE-family HTH domain